MSAFHNNILLGSAASQSSGGAGGDLSPDSDYKIERSLRFNSDDSSYLNQTFSSSNQKTFTLSCWAKISKLNAEKNILVGQSNWFRFENTNELYYWHNASTNVRTDAKFRDPNAWYHIVLAVDTTQGTASNRVKIYVNGVQQTLSGTQPSPNADLGFNGNYVHYLGSQGTSGSNAFNGYLAEVHFIDGLQLAASDFGVLDDNNVWQPKEYTGSHNSPAGVMYSNQTITNENSGYPTARMFDGSTSNLNNSVIANETNGTYSVYTFANAISYSSSVRIYGDLDTRSTNPDIKANSTSVTGFSNNQGLDGSNKKWYTVLTGSGTLSTISLNQYSGYVAAIYAIEVDGTVLVDSNASAGVNGFYLDFSDNSSNSALGTDSSGNSNNFTVNNFSVAAGALNVSRGSNYDTESSTYTEQGTVSQASSLSLPMSNPSHYEGAALRPNSGGFRITATNSASTEFFMACWVRLDNLSQGNQMGVDIQGSYKYFEIQSDGDVKIRHVSPGSQTTSTSQPLSTNTWHHIALSRSGNTLTGFVDGTAVVTTTCGNATNTITANEEFNFFSAATGAGYTINGYILDAVVYVGAGRTANYTVPSSPLITSSGSINDVAGMSSSNRVYASPLISVGAGDEGIDSLIDTPTNYEADSGNHGGNYAVLSAVDNSGVTLSNGSLEVSTSGWQSFKATIGVSSGKYYWETQNKQSAAAILGVATAQASVFPNGSIFGSTGHGGGDSNPAWCWAGANYYFNATSAGTGLSNHSATDIVMYALDLDNGKLWFGRNGTWYDSSWGTTGNPAAGANATVSSLNTSYTYFPAGSCVSGGAIYNFGQRPFKYTPPSGFKSLCTKNIPAPTVSDPSTVFDVREWVGNSSNRTISLDFNPDFVWIKAKSNGFHHQLYDVIRGDNKRLNSSNNSSEATAANSLSFLNSNGFSLGTDNNGDVNGGGPTTYYAWAWDAGSSTASNTNGSITSSVRANPSAGISIVSWTGNNGTVGHGLNHKPGLILTKIRNSSSIWPVQHSAIGTNILQLQSNVKANADSDNRFNATAATSSVFTAGTWWNSDSQGIAYCFAPVSQFSAFGVYTGNGSSNGPFVHTGFKPKFIMGKRTDSDNDWFILDTEREPSNPASQTFYANSSNTADSGGYYHIDILSNGFKLRDSYSKINANNGDYVYVAFAENPFSLNGGIAR